MLISLSKDRSIDLMLFSFINDDSLFIPLIFISSLKYEELFLFFNLALVDLLSF